MGVAAICTLNKEEWTCSQAMGESIGRTVAWWTLNICVALRAARYERRAKGAIKSTDQTVRSPHVCLRDVDSLCGTPLAKVS